MMLYQLRTDIVEDERGIKHVTYGVNVYQLFRSYPDVFTNERAALCFLERCNAGQPAVEHLEDLLHDAVL